MSRYVIGNTELPAGTSPATNVAVLSDEKKQAIKESKEAKIGGPLSSLIENFGLFGVLGLIGVGYYGYKHYKKSKGAGHRIAR